VSALITNHNLGNHRGRPYKKMNWLDIGISITTVLFAFMGLRRGFIREAFSIVAIGGAIVAGVMFYPYARDLFIQYNLVKGKAIASAGGFIVITFGIYLAVKLIGRGLSGVIGALHLGWLDKIGGGIFGAVKGLILVFIVISVVGLFFHEKGTLVRHSVLFPYINKSFSVLKEIIPRDFGEKIEAAKKLIEENGIKPAMKGAEKAKEIIKESDKKGSSKQKNLP
jgi:membrane protein required for colicin V production